MSYIKFHFKNIRKYNSYHEKFKGSTNFKSAKTSVFLVKIGQLLS